MSSSFLAELATTRCSAFSSGASVTAQAAIFLWIAMFIFAKMCYLPEKRSWFQRGIDASKLAIGDLWLHLFNLKFSSIAAIFSSSLDPCETYCSQILVSCTIGVLFADSIFGWLLRLVKWKFGENVAIDLVRRIPQPKTSINDIDVEKNGVDREPLLEPQDEARVDREPLLEPPDEAKSPFYVAWLCQVVFWCLVVTLMKISVIVSSPFAVIINMCWYKLMAGETDAQKTGVAMFLVPFIFDPIQYMLFDWIFNKHFKRYQRSRQLREALIQVKDLDQRIQMQDTQYQEYLQNLNQEHLQNLNNVRQSNDAVDRFLYEEREKLMKLITDLGGDPLMAQY